MNFTSQAQSEHIKMLLTDAKQELNNLQINYQYESNRLQTKIDDLSKIHGNSSTSWASKFPPSQSNVKNETSSIFTAFPTSESKSIFDKTSSIFDLKLNENQHSSTLFKKTSSIFGPTKINLFTKQTESKPMVAFDNP